MYCKFEELAFQVKFPIKNSDFFELLEPWMVIELNAGGTLLCTA